VDPEDPHHLQIKKGTGGIYGGEHSCWSKLSCNTSGTSSHRGCYLLSQQDMIVCSVLVLALPLFPLQEGPPKLRGFV
jgi:hypothetical protein